jgi:hypothetical protein
MHKVGWSQVYADSTYHEREHSTPGRGLIAPGTIGGDDARLAANGAARNLVCLLALKALGNFGPPRPDLGEVSLVSTAANHIFSTVSSQPYPPFQLRRVRTLF